MTLPQDRKSSFWAPLVAISWRSGMPLLIQLLYVAFFQGALGNETEFIAGPSKPTVALLGSNVTFVWKFHTAHLDDGRLSGVVFGKWSHDGHFVELKVSCGENKTSTSKGNASLYWQCVSKHDGGFAASFHLVNVTMKDVAMYGCRLLFGRYKHAITDSVQLLIGAPARITGHSTSMQQLKVKQNQPSALKCDVTGEPPPVVAWIRDGHVVQNSTRDSSYRIHRASVNLTGVYTCIASNQLGSDTKQILLIVTSCTADVIDSEHKTQEETSAASEDYSSRHAFVSMLAVGSVLILICLAYCFFNWAGRTVQKSGPYTRIPKDTEMNSHVTNWKSFSDDGCKI